MFFDADTFFCHSEFFESTLLRMLMVGLVSAVLMLEASLQVGLVSVDSGLQVGEYLVPFDSEGVGVMDLIGGRSATFSRVRLGHGGEEIPRFPPFLVVDDEETSTWLVTDLLIVFDPEHSRRCPGDDL
jgi:hypothetical protein